MLAEHLHRYARTREEFSLGELVTNRTFDITDQLAMIEETRGTIPSQKSV
jgi:hypothetical protein